MCNCTNDCRVPNFLPTVDFFLTMEKIETSLTETEVNMDTFLDEGGTMDVGLKN